MHGVEFLMSNKARALFEAFATDIALMAHLACVGFAMRLELRTPSEFFPTERAIELLVSVNELVRRKIRFYSKALSTGPTLERFLSRVDSLVSDERRTDTEAFFARLTLERFLSCVASLVSNERRTDIEAFITIGASMGFLASVNHSVPSEG